MPMDIRRLTGALAALAVLLPACGGVGFRLDAPLLTEASPTAAPSPLPDVDPSGQPIVDVVDKVRPAVVNVRSNPGTPQQGVGSGFVVDPEGVIVTNFHVVRGAERIAVLTSDGQELDARPVVADPNADLAVLKVEAGGLASVELGDSENLRLGESVVALGFALALEGGPSVTAGIVSAKGRSIEAASGDDVVVLEDLIQTDAAINPGNSGGPLVDLAGRVVGINTAGVGAAAAENVGFAIAIDRARPIIERAIENPDARLAFMGVTTQPVTPLLVAELDLPIDRGAFVGGVNPAGPADRAGISEGDVIVRVGDERVEDNDDLLAGILAHEPGESAEVEVVRPDGSRETLRITFGVRPEIPLG